MSDTSQGPGWWQASDLKWYPPEQVPAAGSPAGTQSSEAAPGAQGMTADPVAGAWVPPPAPAPGPGAPSSRASRRTPLLVGAVLLGLLVVGGVVAYAESSGTGSTPQSARRPIPTPTSTARPAGAPGGAVATTVPGPTTTTTAVPAPATTDPNSSVTSEMKSWSSDQSKCGPSPSNTGGPYSPTQTYRVTGSIHVWSAPTTTSTVEGTIVVTSYGSGGIGCPGPSDPMVTLTCATTGQPVTGPFSTDPTWERTTWNGTIGYVPDEWVDTQWDAATLPHC